MREGECIGLNELGESVKISSFAVAADETRFAGPVGGEGKKKEKQRSHFSCMARCPAAFLQAIGCEQSVRLVDRSTSQTALENQNANNPGNAVSLPSNHQLLIVVHRPVRRPANGRRCDVKIWCSEIIGNPIWGKIML